MIDPLVYKVAGIVLDLVSAGIERQTIQRLLKSQAKAGATPAELADALRQMRDAELQEKTPKRAGDDQDRA